MRIAINGAGIAGPTLAYWLRRTGHEVILVEQAAHLRGGGYVVDFWGVGYDIAEKMGLIPRVRELGYQVKEVRFVDRHGGRSGGFAADVLARLTHGRFTSLRRSDLAATIYGSLNGQVETIFGDSVASVESDGRRVSIGFDHAAPREVDLLIGADGLHSRIRALAFAREPEFDVSLGYHVAAFELEGYRPRDELVYVSHSVPGRQVSRFAIRDDRTLFLFVFRDEYLPAGTVSSDQERKAALTSVYAQVGWECPQILAAMEGIREIYFDRVSQIRMPEWSRGRVALVGDAAACVSLLAGEGTGLAMTEAYVLAGELHRSPDDVPAALGRYQRLLQPFLRKKQQSALRFASSFAPKTALGVSIRNGVTRLLGIPALAEWFVGRELRDDLELPEYEW